MNPGLAGFRANKNPDLSHSGIWKMTKRDSQASEYAAESYEKPSAERGVSNTFDLLTDANDFLLDMATRRVARTHYEGCRTDHVECLVAALVDSVTRHKDAIRRLADQDATLSVCDGSVTVTMDATLTDEERAAIETAVRWLEPYPQVSSILRELLERLGGER